MPFDPEKLTSSAQKALIDAQREAEERHHPTVEPLHLLTALINDTEGIVASALKENGDLGKISQEVKEALEKMPQVAGEAKIYISASLASILEQAEKERSAFGDDYLSTEHQEQAFKKAKLKHISKESGEGNAPIRPNRKENLKPWKNTPLI